MSEKVGQAIAGGMFIVVGVINCALGLAIANGCTVVISKEVK